MKCQLDNLDLSDAWMVQNANTKKSKKYTEKLKAHDPVRANLRRRANADAVRAKELFLLANDIEYLSQEHVFNRET